MQKPYQAKTDISINVHTAGGQRHVRFIPLTMAGSFFTTADALLQEAIERHPKFGRQIVLLPEPEPVAEDPGVEPAEEEEVTFCSLADAKEYLASRFDISRTRLRTADQIYEAARSNHLKVVIQ